MSEILKESANITNRPIKFLASCDTEFNENFQRIQFLGYIVSTRNLGSIVFLVLQDQYGYIQGLLQHGLLEPKILNFLLGKKVLIIGKVLQRKQVSKSKIKMNPSIELDAEQIYLLDIKGNHIPVLHQRKQDLYDLFESNIQLLEKNKKFDLLVQYIDLISIARKYLINEKFLELDKGFYNDPILRKDVHEMQKYFRGIGFEQHFHFNNTLNNESNPRLELAFSFNMVSYTELYEYTRKVINEILHYHSLGPISPFDFSSYKLLHLDNNSQDFNFDILKENEIFTLSFPMEDLLLLHIEEMINTARLKTGVNLRYLLLLDSETLGTLKNTFSMDSISRIIELTKAEAGYIIFFAAAKETNLSILALGSIVDYITSNLKKLQQRNSLNNVLWISPKNKNILSSSTDNQKYYQIIFNGRPIGEAVLSDFTSLSLDLNSLNRKIQNLPYLHESSDQIYNNRYNVKCLEMITEREIINHIENIDKDEKEEISALINQRRSQGFEQRKLQVLKPVLADFDMDFKASETLINLLPLKSKSLLDGSLEEIFKLLWSLLGHKHVLEIIHNENAMGVLKYLCDKNIITDYRQILFMRCRTLLLMRQQPSFFEEDISTSLSHLLRTLKAIICGAPNDFSNFWDFLAQKTNFEHLNHNLHEKFLSAVRYGLSTPIFFNFFLKHQNKPETLKLFCSCIRNLYPAILQNRKIEINEIINIFLKTLRYQGIELDVAKSDSLFAEIIYFIFKPLNMDLEAIGSYLGKLEDATHHFELHGIQFSGDHWDKIEECYCFSATLSKDNSRHFLKIYPSKNIASFFAKASSGICTGIDLDLFRRDNHFHLNIVTPVENRVLGNIQLYVLFDDNKKILFIRGLNPSASLICSENTVFLLNSILQSAIEISKNSKVDELLLCPSLGIWHVESSRIEMISALSVLSRKLPKVPLKKPLMLFHFAKQDKYIHFGYRVWRNGEETLSNPTI